MTTPSNENTSGLEVVRLEAQSGGPSGSWFLINDPDDVAFWEEQGYPVRSLVTAASAQARIAELSERMAASEAMFRLQCGATADVLGEKIAATDRATAAEARADRLAKALERARSILDNTAVSNALRMVGALDQIDAALQQETQK